MPDRTAMLFDVPSCAMGTVQHSWLCQGFLGSTLYIQAVPSEVASMPVIEDTQHTNCRARWADLNCCNNGQIVHQGLQCHPYSAIEGDLLYTHLKHHRTAIDMARQAAH